MSLYERIVDIARHDLAGVRRWTEMVEEHGSELPRLNDSLLNNITTFSGKYMTAWRDYS